LFSYAGELNHREVFADDFTILKVAFAQLEDIPISLFSLAAGPILRYPIILGEELLNFNRHYPKAVQMADKPDFWRMCEPNEPILHHS
jgi:hypothetical protein